MSDATQVPDLGELTVDCSTMPAIRAFEGWDDRAWVRTGQHAGRSAPGAGAQFFPHHLVPHAHHPHVLARPESDRHYLMAQHLFQWLTFTVHFELSVVNRATLMIADGSSGVTIPDLAKSTAYQIYIDEGYHSLQSLRVRQQIEQSSAIPALPYDFGRFLRRLDAIGEERPGHTHLLRLLQVVVFETLVTSIFADVPADPAVLPVVRRLVAEHAVDERRHHAFFASFFWSLWGALDARYRRLVAEWLPELVLHCLQPATRPALDALLAVGMPLPLAEEVIAESYDRSAVHAYIRSAARKTLKLFENLGVMDLPGSRERFYELGLLVEGSPASATPVARLSVESPLPG